MAVTAVQAPRLPGGQASVVLDCSVYPRASLPSRAGRPDVTAFGRWDDPSGNSAHAVGRFVSAHVGDRRWGARRWHRAGVIRRRRRRRRRGGAGASADGAGEIRELPAVSPTGLRGGALALAALGASAAATAAAAWLAAGDRSADGVGAEAAAATYTVPPAPRAATAAAAREMATACWAAADARSGRRRVGAPCTRRVYGRPPGGVAAETPLCPPRPMRRWWRPTRWPTVRRTATRVGGAWPACAAAVATRRAGASSGGGGDSGGGRRREDSVVDPPAAPSPDTSAGWPVARDTPKLARLAQSSRATAIVAAQELAPGRWAAVAGRGCGRQRRRERSNHYADSARMGNALGFHPRGGCDGHTFCRRGPPPGA